MISQENATGYAGCSIVARRFGSPCVTCPVREGSVIPFRLTPSEVMRAAFAQTGFVPAGAEGTLTRFLLDRRGNSGQCVPVGRRGIYWQYEGYSALIGAICRKIGIVAGKRLQFSKGWGKRKQERDLLSKEVAQMLGNQERRCKELHARIDMSFEEIDTTNEAFCGVVTGSNPHELKLKLEFSRGE